MTTPLPLAAPPPSGYLHIGAAVEGTRGRTPFPRRTGRRAALLAALRPLAGALARHPAVRSATVYDAVLIPPPRRRARGRVPAIARSDVAVLVETAAAEDLGAVRDSEACVALLDALGAAAAGVRAVPARCVRRIADVDRTRQGLFLFNHFVAEDPAAVLEVWERVAAWYVAHTGLDNSTLLEPLGADDYAFVNHARWDLSVPAFAARQFGNPGFRSHVLGELDAHGVGALPVLYRLAS